MVAKKIYMKKKQNIRNYKRLMGEGGKEEGVVLVENSIEFFFFLKSKKSTPCHYVCVNLSY